MTQTQALYCPPSSVVRMFEGRLIAWLPLISAGTKNPVAGRLWPSRMLSAQGQESQKTRSIAGKVTVENYGEVNYRFVVSCFKIADSKITHGITLKPPSKPLVKELLI